MEYKKLSQRKGRKFKPSFLFYALFPNKSGKQGKVVHTLRFCSKFPYGISAKSACWGVSPIPIEHTINCVATLPPGAKNDRNIIFLPVIFLSLFLINHHLEAGQYLPLQSVHFAFLFLQNGTLHRLFSFQKVVPYIPFAKP